MCSASFTKNVAFSPVKSMEFDNFESVWQRVTAQDEEHPLPTQPENKREEKLCVIKRSKKSCAVRFAAGQ